MTRNKTEIIHATCVSIGDIGVVLRGPAAAGKSDLALRLLNEANALAHSEDADVQLVADDRVTLNQRDGRLFGSAPDAIAGMLEIRGLGVLSLPHRAKVELGLVVDLVPLAQVARMPEENAAPAIIAGTALPRMSLYPFEVSATAKLRAAVYGLKRGSWLNDRPIPIMSTNKS